MLSKLVPVYLRFTLLFIETKTIKRFYVFIYDFTYLQTGELNCR